MRIFFWIYLELTTVEPNKDIFEDPHILIRVSIKRNQVHILAHIEEHDASLFAD